MTYIKENKQMLATIVCGTLMLLGFIVDKNHMNFAPIIYIIGMIIGGFSQTKEGIEDTIENKHLSVDLLMALAAIGACTIQFYFEGIMLTFIFSLSGSLEEYTTSKSKKEIENLMAIQPENAFLLLADNTTKEVPVAELKIGDTLLVPKGSSVPIDGELLSDHSSVDEAAITGESIPVEKLHHDALFAGTINVGNAISMIVTKEAKDTLFSKIIQLVIVPLMIFLPYFVLGWTWNESFYRGMVLLVVASPCALVASATPATLAAISNGAKNGVLFKGGVFLESLSDLKAITFDKTGTLTKGIPVVTDEIFIETQCDKAISALVTIEKNSTHPLANAIVRFYQDSKVSINDTLIVEEITGSGMQATEEDTLWKVGNSDFVTNKHLDNKTLEKTLQLQQEGKTVIYLSKNNQVVAFFGLLDVPKPEAIECVNYFKKVGITTTMLTGDHHQTANAVAQIVGVDHVIADCLPEDKTIFIKEQKDKVGTNAMIGDGINDAPALANATIGVAMGQGTDIAIDVADIVLMQNDLNKLAMSHEMSLKLKKIVTENIIFSISMIVLLIISNFLQVINLPLGVIGHEGSTILVILNGLRLLKPIKKEKKPFYTQPKTKTAN